jgi:hypothetical protein
MMQNPEGIQPEPVPPSADRLTMANRDRYRAEYEAAAAARRALLASGAPWWRRALAWLPDTQRPLRDWLEVEKRRLNNRS